HDRAFDRGPTPARAARHLRRAAHAVALRGAPGAGRAGGPAPGPAPARLGAAVHETRVLVSELLEMTAGPILWLAHLLAVYGATALVCAERLPIESGGAALAVGAGAVTVLAIAVSGWLLVRALREQAD